jgi:hypothetical protein
MITKYIKFKSSLNIKNGEQIILELNPYPLKDILTVISDENAISCKVVIKQYKKNR